MLSGMNTNTIPSSHPSRLAKTVIASSAVFSATLLAAAVLQLGVSSGEATLAESFFSIFAPVAEALERIAMSSLS